MFISTLPLRSCRVAASVPCVVGLTRGRQRAEEEQCGVQFHEWSRAPRDGYNRESIQSMRSGCQRLIWRLATICRIGTESGATGAFGRSSGGRSTARRTRSLPWLRSRAPISCQFEPEHLHGAVLDGYLELDSEVLPVVGAGKALAVCQGLRAADAVEGPLDALGGLEILRTYPTTQDIGAGVEHHVLVDVLELDARPPENDAQRLQAGRAVGCCGVTTT